jgi:hypothetical protein
LLRTRGAERVLFVANLSGTAVGAFSVNANGQPTVLEGEGLVGSPGTASGAVTIGGLAPYGFAYLSLQ